MDSLETINKALPIFLQYKSLEDEDLIEVFIQKGFLPDVARKIIVFMPIAFGRIIVGKLGAEMSDEFYVCEMKGSDLHKEKRKLKDVEIYRESFKIASKIAKKDEEIFWNIAGRSAELNAISQMKAQGVDPRNGVLTPMMTMWEIEKELPFIETRTTQANQKEKTQKKNWWEFWK